MVRVCVFVFLVTSLPPEFESSSYDIILAESGHFYLVLAPSIPCHELHFILDAIAGFIKSRMLFLFR